MNNISEKIKAYLISNQPLEGLHTLQNDVDELTLIYRSAILSELRSLYAEANNKMYPNGIEDTIKARIRLHESKKASIYGKR